MLGYLHVKDVLDTEDPDAPFPRTALRRVAPVAAETRLDDVLTAMRHSGAHLAAVTDGDGTLLGVVTMADVLKELVGGSTGAYDGRSPVRGLVSEVQGLPTALFPMLMACVPDPWSGCPAEFAFGVEGVARDAE